MTHVNRTTRKKDPELVEKTKILANSLKAYEGKDFEQLSADELERFKRLSLECHTLERLGYKVPISDSLSKKINLAVKLLASSTGNTLHSDVNYYEATNANERTANSGVITDPEEIQKLLSDPDKFKNALESGKLSTKDASKQINAQFTSLEDFYKAKGKNLSETKKKALEGIFVLYTHLQSLPESERQQAYDEMPESTKKLLDQIPDNVQQTLSRSNISITPKQLTIARQDVQEYCTLRDEFDRKREESQCTLACAYVLRDCDPKEPANDHTRRGEVINNRCKTACCVLIFQDKELLITAENMPKGKANKGAKEKLTPSPLFNQENATKVKDDGAKKSLRDAEQETPLNLNSVQRLSGKVPR